MDGIDETLDDVLVGGDVIGFGLDHRGVRVEARVGDEEHLRLPARRLLDGEGFGGGIALLGGFLVAMNGAGLNV
jgi:hypothetical protein